MLNFHAYLHLLHGSQVLQLGIVDLLLQHQLLEVLSRIGLSLQRLQGLEEGGADEKNGTRVQKEKRWRKKDDLKEDRDTTEIDKSRVQIERKESREGAAAPASCLMYDLVQ